VTEMREGKMASLKQRVPEESLGMTVDEITSRWVKEFNLRDRTGVVILEVVPDSPAEEANLQPGDVIREMARKPIRDLKDYQAVMERMHRSRSILLFISRGGQTFYASIKVS
jgi:serine protease Do